MNNPNVALAWEFWRRSSLGTLIAIAIGVAVPSLVHGFTYSHLYDGYQDHLHSFFFALVLPAIVYSAFTGAGEPQAKFTLPATSQFLVGASLLWGTISAVAAYAVIVWVHQRLHAVSWPLLKPAAYLAVTFIWCHGQCWTLDPAFLGRKVMVWCISLAVPNAAICFVTWTGGIPSSPWRNWYPGEPAVLALLAVMGVSYSIRGMAKARRGEPRWSETIWHWITSQLDRGDGGTRSFNSPQAAELWIEWREKGRWLLVLTGVAVGSMATLLLLGVATADQAPQLVVGFSWMILLSSALFGGYLGHCGAQFDVRSFKATRPLSDTQLADGILQSVAMTTAICWLLWVAGTGSVLWFTYGSFLPGSQLEARQFGIILFAILLAAWTVPSLGAALFLNRRLVLGAIGVGMFCLPICLNLIIGLSTPLNVAEAYQLMVGWAVSLAFLLGSTLIFGSAFALRLIGTRRCLIAGMITAGTLLVVYALTESLAQTPAQVLVSENPISLAVWACFGVAPALPLAATPLAMWSNRHR